jgi:hypothetical protein
MLMAAFYIYCFRFLLTTLKNLARFLNFSHVLYFRALFRMWFFGRLLFVGKRLSSSGNLFFKCLFRFFIHLIPCRSLHKNFPLRCKSTVIPLRFVGLLQVLNIQWADLVIILANITIVDLFPPGQQRPIRSVSGKILFF